MVKQKDSEDIIVQRPLIFTDTVIIVKEFNLSIHNDKN